MKKSFFQFSNPEIVNLEFCANEDFDTDLFEGFKLDNNIRTITLEENKEAVVSLQLVIGEKSNKFPFYVTITMSAQFTCEEEEAFQKMVTTNAPALLLSYARPVVSMITSQSGYPTLHLPFMNFTE